MIDRVSLDEEVAIAAINALLAKRAPGATICPSEAARRLSASDWRGKMSIVHQAVGILIKRDEIITTWRGAVTPDPGPGPYRIRRREKSLVAAP